MPTDRMAPPPGASPPMRMTASWSGPQPTYRIQVCGVKTRLKWRAPLGSFAEHRTVVDHDVAAERTCRTAITGEGNQRRRYVEFDNIGADSHAPRRSECHGEDRRANQRWIFHRP